MFAFRSVATGRFDFGVDVLQQRMKEGPVGAQFLALVSMYMYLYAIWYAVCDVASRLHL